MFGELLLSSVVAPANVPQHRVAFVKQFGPKVSVTAFVAIVG